MNVAVKIQLGLSGASQVVAPIWLDAPSVGSAANWSGSYHILSMGKHFNAYAVTTRLPTLPVIPGFPLAHPYARLTGKIRAAGVTGNIGESIAALFARRYLGASIADIAHVRPTRTLKTPDYIMRIGASMPGVFAPILHGLALGTYPDWLPVESKARNTTSSVRQARKEALEQLVAYWSLIASARPYEVGFGMAVTFNYQNPREIIAALFAPRNQPGFRAQLANGTVDLPNIRQYLYGC